RAAAAESRRDGGGVPVQADFGQQRRLDRQARGRGEWRPLVRLGGSERKELVVRPLVLPRGILVTGQESRELRLEGWMQVAVRIVIESVRHRRPPCGASTLAPHSLGACLLALLATRCSGAGYQAFEEGVRMA